MSDIQLLIGQLKFIRDYECTTNDEVKAMCKAIEILSNLPERKTGRWIYDNEAYPGGNPCGHYDCDQCGESVPHKTNFCPNCGAKMEVEHEDR